MPAPLHDVQEHVARIAASSGFTNSELLRELLQYTVTEALAGRGSSLKESVLGVAVFGRKPGYDSDSNSICGSSLRVCARSWNNTTKAKARANPGGSYFLRGATLPSLCGGNRWRRRHSRAALSCFRSLVQAATLMTNTS